MQLETIKIIPRILGGIGNQLFCYAAARRLAVVNNTELVIDNITGFSHDYIYQRQYQLDNFKIPCRKATKAEILEPLSRIRRYIKRKYNHYLPFEKRNYIQQYSMDFEPRLLSIKPKKNLYLEGYWQSEQYFKDIEKIIRTDLEIIPPTDTTNLRLSDHIEKSISIALHIRFFDSPQHNETHNIKAGYYEQATRYIDNIYPDAHYFIFSDRPSEVFNYIPRIKNRSTFISNNKGDNEAYADLWLMSQCQHFIIANSTFSWWGAWLATNDNKRIIAPSVILEGKTAWGFKGLLPDDWIKI